MKETAATARMVTSADDHGAHGNGNHGGGHGNREGGTVIFLGGLSLGREPEIIKSLEGDGNKGRVADRIVCPAACWERSCPD